MLQKGFKWTHKCFKNKVFMSNFRYHHLQKKKKLLLNNHKIKIILGITRINSISHVLQSHLINAC